MSKLPPRILLVYRCYSSSFTAYPWVFARDGHFLVDTIAPKGHVIRHSVWANQCVEVNPDEDFLDRLSETLEQGAYAEMLCIDEPSRTLVLTGANRPEFAAYLPFPPDSPLIAAAVNKSKFYQWCAQVGLDTPKSITCHSSEEVRRASTQFPYPYVLKAAEGAGGQHVYAIQNTDELARVLSSGQAVTEWIVQEYLRGPVGTTMFVARKGKLYAHCSFENRICTSDGMGPAAVCRRVASPELERIVNLVAGLVDGFTGYDWIMREDGSYVLIDPHFGRTAPTAVCAHLIGVDFGQAYFAAHREGPPPATSPPSCSVIWVFPQFWQLIFKGGCRRAWRSENFPRHHVKYFLYGKGEWRMFILQTLDYMHSQARIFGGKWRRRIVGS